MNNKTRETATQIQAVNEQYSAGALEFGDITVYNEMADQTSIKLNMVEQIHSQLNQLEEMTLKRQFMMKEVLQYIVE